MLTAPPRAESRVPVIVPTPVELAKPKLPPRILMSPTNRVVVVPGASVAVPSTFSARRSPSWVVMFITPKNGPEPLVYATFPNSSTLAVGVTPVHVIVAGPVSRFHPETLVPAPYVCKTVDCDVSAKLVVRFGANGACPPDPPQPAKRSPTPRNTNGTIFTLPSFHILGSRR